MGWLDKLLGRKPKTAAPTTGGASPSSSGMHDEPAHEPDAETAEDEAGSDEEPHSTF